LQPTSINETNNKQFLLEYQMDWLDIYLLYDGTYYFMIEEALVVPSQFA
jgi:hypothetical protein